MEHTPRNICNTSKYQNELWYDGWVGNYNGHCDINQSSTRFHPLPPTSTHSQWCRSNVIHVFRGRGRIVQNCRTIRSKLQLKTMWSYVNVCSKFLDCLRMPLGTAAINGFMSFCCLELGQRSTPVPLAFCCLEYPGMECFDEKKWIVLMSTKHVIPHLTPIHSTSQETETNK